MSNDAVVAAIRAHHEQLAEQSRGLTAALLAAARAGGFTDERDALYDWCRTELVPHALAEEQTMYRAGAELEPTRLLVRGMVAEHEALVGLIERLPRAADPLEAATGAVAVAELFAVHLAKENDLLLPALDAAGVDLESVLAGMHELLGAAPAEAEPTPAGCGCGCAHEPAGR